MIFKNETYDRLKWIALVFLPAAEVLWLALGKIWGFPLVVEIGSTIAAVDVFLGTLLGVSGKTYQGTLQQDAFNDEGDDMFEEVEDYEEATEAAEE